MSRVRDEHYPGNRCSKKLWMIINLFFFDIDDFSAYPIFLPPKQDQSDIPRALRAKVAPGPNDMSKCGAPPVPRFHRRPGKHS